MTEVKGMVVGAVMGGTRGGGEKEQQVEPLDEIKKKSLSAGPRCNHHFSSVFKSNSARY